jgi:hypothetical protein
MVLSSSCIEEKKNSKEELATEAVASNSQETKNSAIESIKQKICNEFPKALVLKYNPDATHIEIEPVDDGSGGILHCDVKMFYGKKEYEYWKGQVYANINKMKDPFWQYNPDKNAALYHKVDGFGEKAVFISNMYQLQILKDGVLYSIVPPNNGSRTSSNKPTKEIALEIAKHYNL